jgi:hypothetical protein
VSLFGLQAAQIVDRIFASMKGVRQKGRRPGTSLDLAEAQALLPPILPFRGVGQKGKNSLLAFSEF